MSTTHNGISTHIPFSGHKQPCSKPTTTAATGVSPTNDALFQAAAPAPLCPVIMMGGYGALMIATITSAFTLGAEDVVTLSLAGIAFGVIPIICCTYIMVTGDKSWLEIPYDKTPDTGESSSQDRSTEMNA